MAYYGRSMPWKPIVAIISAVLAVGSITLVAQITGPEPDLKVSVDRFEPEGQTDRRTNITIRFSNDLVPEDSINRPVTNPPVRFKPELPALARWVDTDMLRIFPDEPLLPATEYVAEMVPGRDYVNGNAINDRSKFRFHTPNFTAKVAGARAQLVRNARATAFITIELSFNYPVAWEELKQAVTVKGGRGATADGLEIEGPIGMDDPTSMKPSRVWQLKTKSFPVGKKVQEYRLLVDRRLQCVDCGGSLADRLEHEIEVPVKIARGLWVNHVRPTSPSGDLCIAMSFSAGVSADEVYEHVSIDPPLEFRVETPWRGVRLRGDFKPVTSYTVSIAPGMASTEGALMAEEFSTVVEFGHLPTSIKFTSPGIYLPRQGNRLLEVETINIDTLSFEFEQIFINNLVAYLAHSEYYYAGYGSASLDVFARKLVVHDLPLPGKDDQKHTSTVDVGAILGDTLKGVFMVNARQKSNRWEGDERAVLMTDLGLMTRLSEDHLMVWVNRLSDVEPVNRATVKLFSKNNQVLLEGRTNRSGVVIFDDIADQIEGFEPFLITAERDGDLSYLRLDQSRLPMDDFDVDGRPYLTDSYEAFLYLDRDIFRPGETAHLVSMVRAAGGLLPSSFPYEIKITDPRGERFVTFNLEAGSDMTEKAIDIPNGAQTGRYNITARIGEEYTIGQAQFQIEEFVPDRIKVEVASEQDSYQPGGEVLVDVTGTMLFGPPAAGNRVNAQLQLVADKFRPDGYTGWTFGDSEREFKRKQIRLGDTTLSEAGEFRFSYDIGTDLKPPSALKATAIATVSEQGGRAVTGYRDFTIHPYATYLGLQTDLERYAKPGEPVTVGVVALTPGGEPTTADSVKLVFSRIVYHSVLERDSRGWYRYRSVKTPVHLDSGWVDVGSDGSEIVFTPPDYGRYHVRAIDPGDDHAALISFYASGWGYAPWSLEQPDRLELEFEQKSYRAGDVAKLQVRAPFPGHLMLTIENTEVQDYQTIEIPENSAEIELPVKPGYFPNVYITATLIRPASEVQAKAPARAFGMMPLFVDLEDQRIEFELTVPEIMRPRTGLPITIQTKDNHPARLTLAAVDAGIHQLTGYTSPDPVEFFYGQRRPALQLYDLYSFIYPEIVMADFHLSPPGGRSAFAEVRERHLNPFAAKRIKPVALWSGVVATDQNGRADINLDVPDFNGQLVVTAVGADRHRFGAASTAVTVRDKIVIQETFPRFVSPGDVVDGFVTIFNNTGQRARIDAFLELEGPAEGAVSPHAQCVELDDGEQGSVVLRFTAGLAPGIIKVRIVASGADYKTESAFELANRPAHPLTVEYGSGGVTLDSAAEVSMPGEFIDGTDEYRIKVSSLAAVSFVRNIEYLLRYPYGCVEQTTSGVFPLLYFSDLAKVVKPSLMGERGHEYFVAKGIERLSRFQQTDGAFSYWPGGDWIQIWSSVYASHFLVEARAAGYEVDRTVYNRLIKFLKNVSRGKGVEILDPHRIYASLVLAKAGELDHRQLNWLKDLDVNELRPDARYQLAACFALAGEADRAAELIPDQVHPDNYEPETGGTFSSGARTNAFLLDLLVETQPDNPSNLILAKDLMESARLGRWYNTQTTSFALMALGKYFERLSSEPFAGEMTAAGTTYPLDTAGFELVKDDLGGETARIAATAGQAFYYWQASGVPTKPAADEFERGIVIHREYLDENGNPLDLKMVKLGQQVVAHIDVKASDKSLRNVVVNDLLPACFEIENPRLATTAAMPWLPEQGGTISHQDIRDDRMLIFTNLSPRRTQHYYYGLRVVSAGEFAVPPVAAECMYNPLLAGASSSGVVTVSRQ